MTTVLDLVIIPQISAQPDNGIQVRKRHKYTRRSGPIDDPRVAKCCQSLPLLFFVVVLSLTHYTDPLRIQPCSVNKMVEVEPRKLNESTRYK